MDIDKLVNDFITKVNFKFKNGDIIDNNKEYFSIYTNVTQERTLVINKKIEKNNVNILKNVLKTHKIKPKSYLKKDLIEEVLSIYLDLFKNLDEDKYIENEDFDMDDESEEESSSEEEKESEIEKESEEESSDDESEENNDLITIEEAEDIFNNLFIRWEEIDGDIEGRMRQEKLEDFLNIRINNIKKEYQEQGIPIKLRTNINEKNIKVYYSDGINTYSFVREKILYG